MNKLSRGVVFAISFFLLSFSGNTQILEASLTPSGVSGLKFSPTVQMRSKGKSEKMTGLEAKEVLRSFLSETSPNEVKFVHEGYSQDKSSFFGIIQILTSNEKHRIFFYCEQKEGEYEITKLRLHER